jgi:hypothetical protein
MCITYVPSFIFIYLNMDKEEEAKINYLMGVTPMLHGSMT